jgi:hypothetical protein
VGFQLQLELALR